MEGWLERCSIAGFDVEGREPQAKAVGQSWKLEKARSWILPAGLQKEHSSANLERYDRGEPHVVVS